MTAKPSHTPSKKPSLKRSAAFNFAGSVLPMFVALVTTPIYLEQIGAARYGVLAIVWMVQGYFGFLDLGLSSATSNRIAQLEHAQPAERESVLWTALLLNAALGIAGGIALYGLMQMLLGYFDMGPELSAELRPALPCVACLVPLSNLISVFNGALVGRERFGTLNAVQLPVTLMYQLVPLGAALLYGPNLRNLVYGTLAAGVAALLVNAIVVWCVFPLRLAQGPRREWVGKLFSFGAWMSVTSLAQPLLETGDRLMISHALGPQAVTYYHVPFNLAVRVRVFPSVFVRTLFPRLSSLDAANAAELSTTAIRGLAALLTPMTVFGMFLMHPFLALWVGQEFAMRATSVGETILVGIWINAVAQIAACHLQATGRPGIVARFQVYEMFPFFALLWWMLHTFGVVGAALAWSARCLLDFVLMFHAARLNSHPTRMLFAPALIVAAAYIATLVFAPLSWPGIGCWIGMTIVALAWAARTEPQACARVLGLLASMRNHTRRWAQGQ
ncbi:flippase [Paraburkholderia tagetis]|uniref:Flippase n=1 Tax=Paraburkholderia tagetis TaxID=2913261 RepID=A0A9X1UIR5_9BURK|nr:flippase [Paraburkholderia tagetis]MCG5075698.1 flippase [Paraburkholderia tagetis]